jgi:hypothetical protein
MCKSLLDNADNPEGVEFVRYKDVDDNRPYQYMGNTKVVEQGRRDDIFQMWNECQKAGTGPIYMFMADDFRILTKGWDTEVVEEFDKVPDKMVVLSCNGQGWEKFGHSGIGFLHKRWIDTLGYMFPNHTYPNNADRWVCDVSFALKRNVRLKAMCECSECKDFIHWRKSKFTWGWRKTYYSQQSQERRAEDVRKINEAINNYTGTK